MLSVAADVENRFRDGLLLFRSVLSFRMNMRNLSFGFALTDLTTRSLAFARDDIFYGFAITDWGIATGKVVIHAYE